MVNDGVFDDQDIIEADESRPCFICNEPSDTISLSFQAPLHRTCTDTAWAAFFEADRKAGPITDWFEE